MGDAEGAVGGGGVGGSGCGGGGVAEVACGVDINLWLRGGGGLLQSVFYRY